MTDRAGPKMTLPTHLVLRVLLADAAGEVYGLQICAKAGLPSGTIHPILARLEKLGWLESRWEDIQSAEAQGRPRRRYYRLTPDGAQQAAAALARAAASASVIAGLLASPHGILA